MQEQTEAHKSKTDLSFLGRLAGGASTEGEGWTSKPAYVEVKTAESSKSQVNKY